MKKNVIRLLMSLVALLTMGNVALAENKLWIEQQADGVMAVMMENDPTAAALQFDVVLPAEVSIEDTNVEGSDQKVYRNPARLNNTQIFKCAKSGNFPNAYTVMIVSMDQKPFVGTTGPVAFFKVRSQVETPVEIKLEKVIITNGQGDKLAVNSSWSGMFSLSSMFVEFYSPYSNNQVSVLPGATFELPFNLRNSDVIAGFQLDVKLPEGFTMDDNITIGSRMSNSSTISVTENKQTNTYRLIAVDILTNQAVRDSGEGTVFTAKIKAPATIADGATITINDVYASTPGNASIMGVGCSIYVVDSNKALSAAKASIKELQDLLDKALATIATACPDVKDNFTGAEIQDAIKNLTAAVDAAFENQTLTGDYDNVMAPVAGIKADIEQLLKDAEAAQAAETQRVADNKKAYDDVIATIGKLETALANAVTVVDTEYADYKDAVADQITAMTSTLAQAKTDAANELKNVEKAGKYSYSIDEAELLAEIEAIVTAAQAAKDKALGEAEEARKENNKKLYDADMESIEGLFESYRNTVAEIQKDYKDFEDTGAELAVRNELDAAKAAVEKAYKAVAEKGVYESPINVEALQASIDKLLTDAKAAQEAARVAANKAAYDKAIEAINALQAELDKAAEDVKAYPAYDATEAIAAIQAQITELKAGADKALAAVEKEGTFNYPVDGTAVTTAIADMLAAAKAAQDKADNDKAEADRKAANEKAYNDALAQIAALQAELDAAKAELPKYPAYDGTVAVASIQNQIDALKNAADKAYNDVATEGKYSYTVDGTAVKTAIADMLAAAKAAQDKADNDKAEAERKAANEAAYNAVLEAIAEIQNHYNDVVAQIESEYPAYVDADANAAVQAQIDAAKAAADAAYAAVAEEGNFSYDLDADGLNEAINKLLADAAAKAKHDQDVENDRQAQNKAAYEASLSTLAEVQAYYDQTVETIKSKYAIFNDTEANAKVQEMIDAAKAAADAAYAAVATEGTYGYSVDTTPLYEAIDKLLADAEAARVEFNNDAYGVVMAVIESLQSQLDAAIETITAEYPDYGYKAEADAITEAISEATNGANAALEAVAEEGVFEYNFDADVIRQMIDKMLQNAKESGVSIMEIENGEVMIFTLDGKRHFNLVQGEVNVVVRKNGETQKMMVK